MIEAHTKNTNRLMLAGIVLCILYLLACSLFNSQLMGWLGMTKANVWILLLSRLMQWGLLLIMILYALRIEKQPFLLWKNEHYKIHHLLLHVLLIYIAVIMAMIPVRLVIHFSGLHEVSSKMSNLKSIIAAYPVMLVLVAVTAGIVEEYIFRSYIQTRLERLFKSPAIAIIGSALLFGGIHYGYGTLVNVLGPFAIGIVFGIYYWKFRNIYALILCHILIDLIALSLMVYGPNV